MLRELGALQPGLSLNQLISMLIVEAWTRKDEVLSEEDRYHIDTKVVSDRYPGGIYVVSECRDRSARTLRLRREVDEKLGALAVRYGGLDRNSTVSVILTSAWERRCGRPE